MHVPFLLMAFAAALPSAASTSPLAGARLLVLPNGLRIVHREHHSVPLVAIDVWVRAGSEREGPEESGAAHILEHMLFKGTAKRKPGEIDTAIEDLGGMLAAGTSRSAAHYYTTISSEHVEAALEVVADAVRNAALDSNELERERLVILDEIARAHNDGRKQAVNAIYGELYSNGPLGRPVLGLPSSVRTLGRDIIARFYRRWYRPEQTTVVLVGDITTSQAEKIVTRIMGDWTGGVQVVEKDAPRFAGLPVAREALNGWAGCGASMPPLQDASNIAAGYLVARLLADGGSGRVPAELRQSNDVSRPPIGRRPSVSIVSPTNQLSDITAEFSPRRDGATLIVTAATKASDPSAALKTVEKAIASLAKEGVTPNELASARRRSLGAFYALVETYAGQARALGEHDVIGDYSIAVELAERLGKINPEDISEFAVRCLDPKRVVRTDGAVGASR